MIEMIILNMIDGEKIEVRPDTNLVGYNNDSNKDVFYLRKEYIGNLQGDFEKQGPSLLTTDERYGIAGFLLSFETFTVGEDYKVTMYFTSAVKSVTVI